MINIDSKDIKVGMYVANLDRPWLGTPFLFQGFLIENEQQIQKIQQICKYVAVDEEKSDKSINFSLIHAIKTAPQITITEQAKTTLKSEPSSEKLFEEELSLAHQVYENVSDSLQRVLNDCQLDKNISVVELTSCVNEVINGVMHNPNALSLLSNLRSKQQDTVRHSVNVSILSLLLGRHLNFNQEQLLILGFSALLHDVGEVKVPKAILDKCNKGLTLEEKKQMELHTQYGMEILKKNPEIPKEAAEVAYAHHERINGKGYPRGLRGAEIHLFARLVTIVDVYETVTNYQIERVRVSCSDALKSIYSMRDNFFDKELVENFIKCLGIYPVGSLIRLNTGEIGIVISFKPGKHLFPTIMVIRDNEGEKLYPPRVISLDNFRGQDNNPKLFITKVLEPSSCGIDLSDYIVRESSFRKH